jgi:GT2 family glycosyltransferase/glycosyltransferase involved in cell wall biosynthesis
VSGHLESVSGGNVRGWAIDESDLTTPVRVQIEVDGIPYCTVVATGFRPELAQRSNPTSIGGFGAKLRHSPDSASPLQIAARIMGASEALPSQETQLVGLTPFVRSAGWSRCCNDPEFLSRRITVIVPVYNAAKELEACLRSLVENTTLACRILIVDDASTNADVERVIQEFTALDQVFAIRNGTNLGFVASCNIGIESAAPDDVVLLNSDTEVPQRWLENLKLAAYSRPRVATVTPLSNNAGVFSAPEINVRNELRADLTLSQTSRLISHVSRCVFPDVPTGHGFCLFMRRACLDEIGALDAKAFPRGYGEENDFCMRALRRGYVNLLDDRTYVHHKGSASFGEEKHRLIAVAQLTLQRRYPEYKALTTEFETDDPMIAVRWRVRRGLARHASAPRLRVLFVLSTRSGGTPQTNEDLMSALGDRYETLLLHCDASRIELSRFDGALGLSETIEHYDLGSQITVGTHSSDEYDEFVAELLVRYAIELVHIRHIAWHSLSLTRLCDRLFIPVVFSFHDFYAICPTVKLLDAHTEPCCLAGIPTATPCKFDLWTCETPHLKPGFINRWREMMTEMLQHCSAFVTTSTDAHGRLCAAFPFLRERDFRVINHGRDFERMLAAPERPVGGQPVRVLVPGNLSPAKGAQLLDQLAVLEGGRQFEFHVLGNPGRLVEKPGLVLHGQYVRKDFLARVQAIDPHMGAVLSRWPETYCHTLTEMWAAGLPIVATDIGALGERIHRHGGGWLLEPAMTAPQVLAALREICTSERAFDEAQSGVLNWQEGLGAHYGNAAMAAHYDVLYRDVVSRRSALTAVRRQTEIWLVVDDDQVRPRFNNKVDRAEVFVPVQSLPALTDPEFIPVVGIVICHRNLGRTQHLMNLVASTAPDKRVLLDLRAAAPDDIEPVLAQIGQLNIIALVPGDYDEQQSGSAGAQQIEDAPPDVFEKFRRPDWA